MTGHVDGERDSRPSYRRAIDVTASATAILATLAGVPAPALAHGGDRGLHATWIPVLVFLFGVAILGASVFLDAREAVDRSIADGGVLVGALAVLTSIGIFWF